MKRILKLKTELKNEIFNFFPIYNQLKLCKNSKSFQKKLSLSKEDYFYPLKYSEIHFPLIHQYFMDIYNKSKQNKKFVLKIYSDYLKKCNSNNKKIKISIEEDLEKVEEKNDIISIIEENSEKFILELTDSSVYGNEKAFKIYGILLTFSSIEEDPFSLFYLINKTVQLNNVKYIKAVSSPDHDYYESEFIESIISNLNLMDNLIDLDFGQYYLYEKHLDILNEYFKKYKKLEKLSINFPFNFYNNNQDIYEKFYKIFDNLNIKKLKLYGQFSIDMISDNILKKIGNNLIDLNLSPSKIDKFSLPENLKNLESLCLKNKIFKNVLEDALKFIEKNQNLKKIKLKYNEKSQLNKEFIENFINVLNGLKHLNKLSIIPIQKLEKFVVSNFCKIFSEQFNNKNLKNISMTINKDFNFDKFFMLKNVEIIDFDLGIKKHSFKLKFPKHVVRLKFKNITFDLEFIEYLKLYGKYLIVIDINFQNNKDNDIINDLNNNCQKYFPIAKTVSLK